MALKQPLLNGKADDSSDAAMGNGTCKLGVLSEGFSPDAKVSRGAFAEDFWRFLEVFEWISREFSNDLDFLDAS